MPDELMTDLQQIQRAAAAQDAENRAFQTFVQVELAVSDRRLNTTVQETTAQVWEQIDCRACANCCRTLQPVFRRAEVQRIAAYLGVTVEHLRVHHLRPDAASGKYITQDLPCPFLDGNLCSIYEVRPAVCADYPHLQKNFRSRLWQVFDNATVCPIVYNVLQRLKQSLGFQGA
ncbi:MAG TPA: YkgJ family cysteine cluster protein [Candidatus Tectomicrobia bacterium]|jgi:Fe-S-cluster containining protein